VKHMRISAPRAPAIGMVSQYVDGVWFVQITAFPAAAPAAAPVLVPAGVPAALDIHITQVRGSSGSATCFSFSSWDSLRFDKTRQHSPLQYVYGRSKGGLRSRYIVVSLFEPLDISLELP
jgi:hypothetical protein